MRKYLSQYFIKISINRTLTHHEINFLNKLLKENRIYDYKNNTAVIVPSIHNINNTNIDSEEHSNYFTGEREIPFQKFQELTQTSELIYTWNDIIKIFPDCKFKAYEKAYVY